MSAQYRPEVDGLRAVAVAAVILFHAGVPGVANGYFGVDVFFVISGYLITRIVWPDIAAGRFSLAHFYERRARRILPALLLTCGLSLLAAWFIMAPPVLIEFAGHLAAALLFGANIVYWLQADYFSTNSQLLPLIHTWSLAVEEQFYLVYPLVLLAIGRAPHRTKVALLAAVTVVSFVAAVILTSRSPDASFYLLPTRLWELTAGALLAVNELRRRAIGSPALSALAWAPLITAGGLAVVVASALTSWSAGSHPGFGTLGPVLATCSIIAFGSVRGPAGWVLTARPVVAVGLISYSLYLFHQPVLVFARIWLARPLSVTETAGAILLAIAGAALSWRFIEQPARSTRWLRPLAIGMAAAISVFVICAAAVIARAGFPARMDASVAITLARIEAGKTARYEGMRLDRCHWYPTTSLPVETFLQRWDCLSDIRDFRPRILVVGDSIASDKAWALREAGFLTANLAGASCRVREGSQIRPQCNDIMAAARDLARLKQVDGIILSNNWRGALDEDEQQAIVDYWKDAAIPILVISGMPTFSSFRDRVPQQIRAGRSLEDIQHDRRAFEAHWQSLTVFRAAGLPVVSSRDLLCPTEPCSAFAGVEPLMSDHVHLSPLGARRMGQNLVRDPIWLRWIEQIGAAPRVAANPL